MEYFIYLLNVTGTGAPRFVSSLWMKKNKVIFLPLEMGFSIRVQDNHLRPSNALLAIHENPKVTRETDSTTISSQLKELTETITSVAKWSQSVSAML